MNVTPATQKLIVTLVVLALIAYVAFTTIFGAAPVSNYIDAEGFGGTEVVGQDILILSDQLRAIKIDKTVFSSPLFTSLVDISQTLLPEDQGRPNPFAPIGSDSTGGATTRPR